MEDINELPIFNSVANAAKRLSIGRTLFARLLREGKIKGCHIGTRILIAESELQRFAEEVQRAAAAKPRPQREEI